MFSSLKQQPQRIANSHRYHCRLVHTSLRITVITQPGDCVLSPPLGPCPSVHLTADVRSQCVSMKTTALEPSARLDAQHIK